jgi:hypothetical protein
VDGHNPRDPAAYAFAYPAHPSRSGADTDAAVACTDAHAGTTGTGAFSYARSA